MQEQLAEILFYVKGTLKYKWVIIIAAWLISSAGWIFVSTMPDEYKSKALVNVDSRSLLRPLLKGMAVQSSSAGLINIMRELMFTRPKLERVAKFVDPDFDSKNEAAKNSVIGKLKRGITIEDSGRPDLFSISFDGSEPKEAQDIVHAVLTVFSEQTQQRGISDTGSAQQFIAEQIREYEVRLRNSEKARENFKRVNSGLLPGEAGGLSSLNSVNIQLQEAKMVLSEISSQERVINEQIDEALDTEGGDEGDEWGLGGLGDQVSTPEDAQIAALQEQINGMLVRYTENYPDVVSLKLQIKDLEERRLETLANMPEDQNIMSSIDNPYMQALKMSLNQIQTEKASIVSRIGVLNKRNEDIQQGMDSSLRIETELQNLDRDYSVIKSNYMQLIKSRETVAMTEKADRSQGVLKFKIVEAPNAPLHPTGPNRKLFSSVFLGVGLAAGGVLAFLIYFIRPTYMSTLQLRTITGLPVLGSVAEQTKEGERTNRSKQILFWSVGISLLLTYIIIMSLV